MGAGRERRLNPDEGARPLKQSPRRKLTFVLAGTGIFLALAGVGCSGSEQSEQTPATPQSSGDPDIDAGRKLVHDQCVRDWYDSGAIGSFEEACPDWDK
jgi:hypothetical protein